jgi:4-hydroxy-tetrahydrodipicolinate reductase
MIRIGIAGVGGRMGREVLAAALADPAIGVVGGIVRPGRREEIESSLGMDVPLVDDVTALIPDIDVLVDFTDPRYTLELARACDGRSCALVCGTTGLSPDHLAELQSIASHTAVFYARNMSVGIAAMLAALPELVQALAGFDVEIVESHHRNKVDAPSGTAIAIAESVARALRQPVDEHLVYGRHGIAPRSADEIGMHSLRGGGNAGEHVVIFAGEGEEIRVSHRAYGRRTFALGAMQAARFMSGRSKGFYTMENLLGVGRSA